MVDVIMRHAADNPDHEKIEAERQAKRDEIAASAPKPDVVPDSTKPGGFYKPPV